MRPVFDWLADAKLRWTCVAITVLCVASLAPLASAQAEPEATQTEMVPIVAALAADTYGERFAAALKLVEADSKVLEPDIQDAVRFWQSKGEEAAAAAGEFVLHELRHEELPRTDNGDTSPPDVVLVSIDTLRADHLHCYGYERPTSPALDALAAGGVLFETAISPSSWTLPVHMSIFTSLYPSYHKIDAAGRLGSTKLDEAIATLPELLQKQGYSSAGFVAIGYLKSVWGFGRGFDFYRDYDTDAKEQFRRAALWAKWHDFHRRRGLVRGPHFSFIHLIDPHGLGHNKIFLEDGVKNTDPRYRIAMYDGQIHFVDAHLKEYLDVIAKTGRLPSTLIVVTSDHGEELGDHGGSGHKNTLYEEQLRVPLIISYPARVKGGRRVSGQVSLLDIAPTILEFAGADVPTSFQGLRLAPLLLDEATAQVPQRTLFAELHPTDFSAGWDFYSRAARGERYKLIRLRFRDGRESHELYDLEEDPGEKKNLYGEAHLAESQRALEKFIDSIVQRSAGFRPDLKEKNRIEIDPTTRERLRALGYDE